MSILDIFNRNYQSYTDQVYGPEGYYTNSPSRMDYNIDANKAATELISNTLQQGLGSFGTPAAAMAELAAPAIAFGASPFHDIAQAAQRARENYDMPTGYGRIYDYMETPVGPTMSEFAKAVAAEQIPSTMIQRAMGAAVPLSNRIQTGLDLIGNFGYSPTKTNNFGVTSDFGYPSVSETMVDEDEEDQLPYSGVGDMRYQTPRTIADQNRVLGQTFTPQKTGGILDLLGKYTSLGNLIRGPGKIIFDHVRAINQKLRNTNFGRSKTLAEYFDRRARAKNAARMAEKYQEFSQRDSGDRGKGMESSSAVGGVYGGGPGGLHSGE